MRKSTFAEAVDVAGSLPIDERQELIEILQKRTIEERRAEIAKEIEATRAEFKSGQYTISSAKDIMKDILS